MELLFIALVVCTVIIGGAYAASRMISKGEDASCGPNCSCSAPGEKEPCSNAGSCEHPRHEAKHS